MLYATLTLMYVAVSVLGLVKDAQLRRNSVTVASSTLISRARGRAPDLFKSWKKTGAITTTAGQVGTAANLSVGSNKQTRVPRLCGVAQVTAQTKQLYELNAPPVKRLGDAVDNQKWVMVTHALMRCTGFVVAVLQHYEGLAGAGINSQMRDIYEFFHQYYDKASTTAKFPACLKQAANDMLSSTRDVHFNDVVTIWLNTLIQGDEALTPIVNAMFRVQDSPPYYCITLHVPQNKDKGKAASGGAGRQTNLLAQLLAEEQKQQKQKKQKQNASRRTVDQYLETLLKTRGKYLKPCYFVVSVERSAASFGSATAGGTDGTKVDLRISTGKRAWFLNMDRAYLLRAALFINQASAQNNWTLPAKNEVIETFFALNTVYPSYGNPDYVDAFGVKQELPLSDSGSEGKFRDLATALFVWITQPEVADR